MTEIKSPAEQIGAAIDVLTRHKLALEYAAIPTKPDVFVICGGEAAEMRDAIKDVEIGFEVITAMANLIEAQARRIEELTKLVDPARALLDRTREYIGQTNPELLTWWKDADKEMLLRARAVERALAGIDALLSTPGAS